MKRLTAVLLTVLMVASLCTVFSSAEDVNLIAGLDGGVVGYGNYTASLTDGKAEGTDKIVFDNTWFGFYCNTDAAGNENPETNAHGKIGTLVYDMGEVCTVNSARIHLALCNAAGIQSPKNVTISVSADGETYTDFSSMSFSVPEEGSNGIDWAEFSGASVAGRYVKVVFELNSVFCFVNEIEILGVKGGDPSKNPVNESSEPEENTSSEEESKPADSTSSETESKTESTDSTASETESKTESAASSDVSTGDSEGASITWLWIVIAVVAVAAIVVLVVVSTKKKK